MKRQKRKNTAHEILTQLKCQLAGDGASGSLALLTWGANNFRQYGSGLAFSVSGMKLKGIVAIEVLDVDNCYDLKIYDSSYNLEHRFENTDSSKLVELIDSAIESS